MTKILEYVEIDTPAISATVSRMAFRSSNFLLDDPNDTTATHTWTAHGNAAVDTGFVAIGSGSLHNPDTTSYIDTPAHADFDFGEGDLTIEFWFFKAAGGVSPDVAQDVCGLRDTSGTNTARSFNIDIQPSPSGIISGRLHQGTTQYVVTGTSVHIGASSVWHHVSFVKYGNRLLLFVDGIQEGEATWPGGAVNPGLGHLTIGRDGDDPSLTNYIGWIDEFTIHRYARRTANFRPERTAFWQLTTTGPQSPTSFITWRFARDARYLPGNAANNIYEIPSLLDLNIDPGSISLGADLGTRTTITAKFRDHKHIVDFEPFDQGSFWGKFRARYGLKLVGRPFRYIVGTPDQAVADMETRYFVIESVNGPSAKGEYEIIAKDVLKFADGDRAQAPALSQGFLNADITNVATTCVLSPSGIGSLYGTGSPPAGKVAIGGSEICNFTRSGDTLTLTRAQNNTVASAHSAQDRVQIVLTYTSQSPADIIYDLLTTYAGVSTSYIDLTAWQTEVNTYLNTVYTAVIAEPTSVADLISELIEQVGLVMWWDSIAQKIKLQVLRPVASSADVFNADNYLANSIEVIEQPEKRLTQVYTYFAKINPLVNADQINNYRSTSFIEDTASESSYGSAVIKKIYSRWIPSGGRSVADNIGNVQIARFKNPPRRIAFDVLRGSVAAPGLGVGYQIGSWLFQDRVGNPITIGAQVTRLTPNADIFKVEAEEISPDFIVTQSPDLHTIIIDSNIFNVNLRTMHDSIYGVPVSGDNVQCTINTGVVVGSTSIATPAFTVGSWPAGVNVTVINNGRIQGRGGAGGPGATVTGGGGSTSAGGNGGNALKATQAFTLNNISGQIWAGGGGGGGNGGNGSVIGAQTFYGAAGGGGGAGTNGGAGGIHSNGVSGLNGNDGSPGTPTAGGAGGTQTYGAVGFAGNGGGPGLDGAAGSNGFGSGAGAGGPGGTRGAALDGVSFITFAGGGSPNGDIRGRQIN